MCKWPSFINTNEKKRSLIKQWKEYIYYFVQYCRMALPSQSMHSPNFSDVAKRTHSSMNGKNVSSFCGAASVGLVFGFWFGFIKRVDKSQILEIWRFERLIALRQSSDLGLTLEMSALQISHGGNSTFINSCDKTKFHEWQTPLWKNRVTSRFRSWYFSTFCIS